MNIYLTQQITYTFIVKPVSFLWGDPGGIPTKDACQVQFHTVLEGLANAITLEKIIKGVRFRKKETLYVFSDMRVYLKNSEESSIKLTQTIRFQQVAQYRVNT